MTMTSPRDMVSPREPAFKVVYQGLDVTEAFGPYALSVTYIDKRHGESDELTLNMHNSDGKWLKEYAPQAGDVMEVWVGYTDELVHAGRFTVDEWVVRGGRDGDEIEISGLSAPKTESLRTKNTKAYENQKLSDIVMKIAGQHGLTVEGEIEEVEFERVTQHGERDLAFLKRLADDYGHYFMVKGKISIFTSRDGLRARAPVMMIDRLAEIDQSLKAYELRDADHKAAKKAESKYAHPNKKAVVGADAESAEDLGVVTASGDVLKTDVRTENEIQAARVAKSLLDEKNAQKITGTLTLVGTPILVAGSVVELKNFGVFDGRYLITQSEHRSERSGYETVIEIERATGKNIQDGKKVSANANSNAAKNGAEYLGEVKADGSVVK